MNNNDSKTTPLTPEPRNLPPRAALVIYHRDGNTVVTLSPGESVVVGRNRPADVVIADHSVSRRHASFAFDGSTVTLTDLGSSNGTTVNGTAVKCDTVEPGDHILLGNAVVALMLLSQGERRPRGLDSLERLTEGVNEDLERARHFGRHVSLLVVAAKEDAVHVGSFAPDVQRHLRPVDHAALLTPTILVVHLSELKAEEARTVANAIVSTCKHLSVGVANYPDLCQGRADAMVEGARAALALARKRGGVMLAEKALARVVDEKAAPIVVNGEMRKLFDKITKFSRSTMPVLICGETGSGKEVVARALHDGGTRKGGPMISVNCGALSPTLIESTLFGTVKTAYTNAGDVAGVFEAAQGGTVFLDEIGELPPEAQKTLLRVLENKTLTRLGSTKEIKVDVRIVAATHKDLEEMCGDGSFRSDLRYRLEGERFDVPPLRSRPEEILPLAKRFFEQSKENHHLDGIDEEACAALRAFDWPGNVRELKNAIERAIVVAAGPLVTVEDLPDSVRRASPSRLAHTGVHRLDDIPLERDEESGPGPASPDDGADYRSKMRAQQAKIIIDALEKCGGVQTAAARHLKMPVRTLVHMMKQLGIKRVQGTYLCRPE